MTYHPQPLATDQIDIPPALAPLREKLAENVHEVWAKTRLEEGWKYGPVRDDRHRLHPCLVPYNRLEESEKRIDRVMVEQTIKTILALGFRIEPGTAFEYE